MEKPAFIFLCFSSAWTFYIFSAHESHEKWLLDQGYFEKHLSSVILKTSAWSHWKRQRPAGQFLHRRSLFLPTGHYPANSHRERGENYKDTFAQRLSAGSKSACKAGEGCAESSSLAVTGCSLAPGYVTFSRFFRLPEIKPRTLAGDALGRAPRGSAQRTGKVGRISPPPWLQEFIKAPIFKDGGEYRIICIFWWSNKIQLTQQNQKWWRFAGWCFLAGGINKEKFKFCGKSRFFCPLNSTQKQSGS